MVLQLWFLKVNDRLRRWDIHEQPGSIYNLPWIRHDAYKKSDLTVSDIDVFEQWWCERISSV